MNTPIKILALSSLIGLMACSSSPTGRNQLLLFSDQEMSTLGTDSFEQLKTKEKISQNAKVNAYVQCVAKAITKNVPKQASFNDWEVVVFESDQVNAFALPAGKIGVYTGLLKVAVNQDQLAAVIGHEIVHVLAQHSNERLSRAKISDSGLQITNQLLNASSYAKYSDTTMAALGVGVQYGIVLPYGRTQESEADVVGLELMAKSGFDPKQSVELWKNMAKASNGEQTPELLSTHPSDETRIANLTKEIEKLPAYTGTRPNCS